MTSSPMAELIGRLRKAALGIEDTPVGSLTLNALAGMTGAEPLSQGILPYQKPKSLFTEAADALEAAEARIAKLMTEPMEGIMATREEITRNLRRLGYDPEASDLLKASAQWRLRQKTERPRSYDEIEWALMEALVIQGWCRVWPGDGLGCAAQIVQAQVERADIAERERAQARRDALEEAAVVADDPESCYACDVAAAIRKLAEKEKG